MRPTPPVGRPESAGFSSVGLLPELFWFWARRYLPAPDPAAENELREVRAALVELSTAGPSAVRAGQLTCFIDKIAGRGARATEVVRLPEGTVPGRLAVRSSADQGWRVFTDGPHWWCLLALDEDALPFGWCADLEQMAAAGDVGAWSQFRHLIHGSDRGVAEETRGMGPALESFARWHRQLLLRLLRVSRSALRPLLELVPPAQARVLLLGLWVELLAEARVLAPPRLLGLVGEAVPASSRRLACAAWLADPGPASALLAQGRVPDSLLGLPERLAQALTRLLRLRLPGARQELDAAERLQLLVRLDLRLLGQLHEELPGRSGPETATRALDRLQGLYYTPAALAELIVHRAVSQRTRGLTRPQLLGLRVLDPAMGAGSILVAALQALVQAAELCPADPETPYDTESSGSVERRARIARDSLYGTEVDPIAVELGRCTLWLAARAPCLALAELGAHLEQRDAFTLLEPAGPGDAGWMRFDFILGNPPYVGERDHAAVLDGIRSGPLATLTEGKMDLWFAFGLLAARLLAPGGIHSFVVPGYWLTASGGQGLRQALLGELTPEGLCDLGPWRPFPRAPGQHSMVYWARRPKPDELQGGEVRRVTLSAAVRGEPGRDRLLALAWPQHHSADGVGERLRVVNDTPGVPAARRSVWLLDEQHGELRGQLLAGGPCRLPVVALRQGLVPNPTRLAAERAALGAPGPGRSDRAPRERGVFVLSLAELDALGPLRPAERDLCWPFLFPRDIEHLACPTTADHRLLYLTRESCPDSAAIPTLLAHLQPFRERLTARREVQLGVRRWFDLHWPREPGLFQEPALLVPRQAAGLRIGFSSGGFVVDLGVNLFRVGEAARALGWSPHGLLALLSSRPVRWWLAHLGKRKGPIWQLDRGPWLSVPLPRYEPSAAQQLEVLGQQVLACGLDDAFHAAVDRIVLGLYGLTTAGCAALARSEV